jgi:hypothetical protein
MKKRMFGMTTVAACVWALSLLTAPGAHAQTQPNVIAQAKAVSDPWVVVFADDASGSRIDDAQTKQYSSLLADSDWYVLDNGQIIISKGQTLVANGYFMTDNALSFFLVHSASDTTVLNGWLFRDQDDPSQGWADVFITFFSKDHSSSITVTYSDSLTFAATAKR